MIRFPLTAAIASLLDTAVAASLQADVLSDAWAKYREALATPSASTPHGFLVDLAYGVITFFGGFVVGGSVLAFLWGAITYQSAAVDEGRKESGKKIMIAAAVGLVAAVLAVTVVNFAKNWFTNEANVDIGNTTRIPNADP